VRRALYNRAPTGAGAEHDGDQLAVLADDPQGGLFEFDGDRLADVGEAAGQRTIFLEGLQSGPRRLTGL
jgi:hypothetical protein